MKAEIDGVPCVDGLEYGTHTITFEFVKQDSNDRSVEICTLSVE